MEQSALRIIRRILGYSQADLAKAVDVDISLICRLEKGQCRDTAGVLKTKALVAEFLGLSVESVFPPED